jgi:hypothetical protein
MRFLRVLRPLFEIRPWSSLAELDEIVTSLVQYETGWAGLKQAMRGKCM